MVVKEIQYRETIKPEGSCGTGYSEPSIFFFKGENEGVMITIDLWYCPAESIKRAFLGGIDWYCYEHPDFEIENINEAFDMFAKVVANKHCPYSYEEIIELNLNG